MYNNFYLNSYHFRMSHYQVLGPMGIATQHKYIYYLNVK